jgi:hypothetical protein
MSNTKACEVCGNENLKTVIDLGMHPLCDDLNPIGTKVLTEQYPIVIEFCQICKTAHQSFQVPKRTLFPESYHYRAANTHDVITGMRQLVESCIEYCGSVNNAVVLDVGCNDGSLLSIFKEEGAKTIGVEPTGAAADAISSGHHVYRDYFSQVLAEEILKAHGKPDIITFTNVFAHIENLPDLLDALKILLGDKTLLVIENHYLGAILEKYQFDTFYHEHPRTYSLTSFKYISATLETEITAVEFPERYGGNIRVLMHKSPLKPKFNFNAQEIEEIEQGFEKGLLEMGRNIPQWIKKKRADIDYLNSVHGPIYGKAFPGRAAILIKLLGLDQKHISAVYEKPGSMKTGHYLPGTSIPILSDDQFNSRLDKTTPVLNLAWHISQEIHEYLVKNGCEAPIIDIFSVEEFELASREIRENQL